jgi:cell division septation protein DedD
MISHYFPNCLGVVMLSKFVLAAVLAVSSGITAAQAQSIASIGGPAELPPASYQGQQYVDSRGCVFLRAGVAGRVTWAPRLDRSRRVLCGYPPSLAARAAPVAVAEAPAQPAPAPAASTAPRPAGAPLETVASAIPRTAPAAAVTPAPIRIARQAPPAPAPVAAAQPPVAVATTAAGSTGRRIGCFTNTPVPVRVQLTNGGTAVLCTRGDGTLEGARAPIYPAGSGVGASLTEPQFAARGHDAPTHVATPSGAGRATTVASVDSATVTPPPGYRVVWDDDRLNPNRARGTAAGQAAQDQIWTRETPARLVSEVQAAEAPQGRVTASSKTEPAAAVAAAPQARGALYVQIGTFGVPENAAGAGARLQALGLPAARSRITQGGRALTIVFAGPFGSTAEAQSALNAARGAGFGDAFIR